MEKVRFGIIGIGNMGSGHMHNILGGKVPGAELAAICDIDPLQLEKARKDCPDSVHFYESKDAMFEKEKLDAVIVATPHYFHPPLAIEAMNRGLNVMSEKPAGVYTKAVREMNAVAEKTGKVFGIMYNQRSNPLYQKMKDLVDSGELGELRRSVWIITDWYRSQAYYDSGSWRATWGGEGGGVLMNQDPHQLDVWQWISGMPTKVHSFMQFGKFRNIEVENEVNTFVEYANGATGAFITCTHEAPGTNRFELTGDKGKLVCEDGKLTFWRNRENERDFNARVKVHFGAPECWKCEIPVKPGPENSHAYILQNFCEAVRTGSPLLAPGIEGIRGLTIANAMYMSAWTDTTVDVATMDEDLYYEMLQKRVAESKLVKPAVNAGESGVV